MTAAEFNILGKELQQLCTSIPLRWGAVQNDGTDRKINLFRCGNLQQLETEIAPFSEEDQHYFRRRWFLWKCSQVDEYLFYRQANIRKNPNPKDHAWDLEFNGSLRFDVKGTVVPKQFRDRFHTDQEKKLIEFYYRHQSKGVRHHLQNRLFLVHHSFSKPERSIFLRCHWTLKEQAYKTFGHRLAKSRTAPITHLGALAKCIFIVETKAGKCLYKIN
ncbi:hypothetical protein [Maribacter sp. 2307ULW6-5]|uniref:hypothetical protein n=1 Tax=Maribacter sp. 2307ULW6-5 TaxID=3386275 RepID=UPI0039BC67B9